MFALIYAVSLDAQTTTAVPQQPTQPPKTVHQLFIEDQEDIPGAANGKSKVTPEVYEAHLKARQAELRKMLAAGEFKTGEDFEEAAFVFQHGNDPNDCLFAHVLSMEAIVHGDTAANWIAAATLDRYLQLTGHQQVFGTQYPLDPNLPHPVVGGRARFLSGRTRAPYNEQFLSDWERADFCVPALAQQKDNVAMFNAGTRPKGAMMRAPGCGK